MPNNYRNPSSSLRAFQDVIYGLGSEKQKHIPYRNSCLTRLLQHSLGGNCMTVFLGTIGPSFQNFSQTHSTLKFMSKTMLVRMHPKPNINCKESLILQFLRPFGQVSDDEPYQILLENEIEIFSVLSENLYTYINIEDEKVLSGIFICLKTHVHHLEEFEAK